MADVFAFGVVLVPLREAPGIASGGVQDVPHHFFGVLEQGVENLRGAMSMKSLSS
ncbi:hypothetical protein ACFYMO_21725 [Streptomyces sp. NPDC007025]|uniref:hypothetical protein n=1 Tax=Streptomyces sp. NPDC007025 TaxID=3364771 RepID=UPI0036B30EA1